MFGEQVGAIVGGGAGVHGFVVAVRCERGYSVSALPTGYLLGIYTGVFLVSADYGKAIGNLVLGEQRECSHTYQDRRVVPHGAGHGGLS